MSWILRDFYLRGPPWLGGWGSRDIVTVCAQMGGVTSEFWAANKEQCLTLIDNKIAEQTRGVALIAGSLLVLTVGWVVICRCCMLNPILATIRLIAKECRGNAPP